MKVIIDANPISFPLTGIGRYTYELARELQRIQDISSLLFLRGHQLSSELPSPINAEVQGDAQSFQAKTKSIKRRLARYALVRTLYRFNHERSQKALLSGFDDHVYHGPNFFLPPFGGKSVVTIHDLSVFTLPDFHPPERAKVREDVLKSLSRASCLLTPSEFTRREVAAYFNWPLDRVIATREAASEAFHPRTATSVAEVLGRYSIGYQEYTLYVGTVEPRKNLSTLLDAYEQLPQELRMRWPLVISGHSGWKSEALHARILSLQDQGWIRYLGYTPNDDLPALYAGARLFVFPSYYEGFGLPVLEAMASGVPVVAANRASLPEVCGNAALLFDAPDVDGLRVSIYQGLEDHRVRDRLTQLGLAQAEKFSWASCARDTLKAYRQAQNV